jgi:N-acyl-D-amino-acid deacylase
VALLAHPEHLPKLMQGVTTEVFTNCGLGFAPVTDPAMATQRGVLGGLFSDDDDVAWGWRSVADLLGEYRRRGTGPNVAYLIPHGAVRVSVMGMAARAATAAEVSRMVTIVECGMADGALGLSTGVWYAPMCHAERDELVALARVAGFVATHQRDYGRNLRSATEETIEISAEASVPIQLSHLQLGATEWHGRSADILAVLDSALARGVDVAWDSYPYDAGATLVTALLPGWASDGGPAATHVRLRDPADRARIVAALNASGRDWSRFLLLSAESSGNAAYEGLRFTEIAERLALPVEEWVCNLLDASELRACYVVRHLVEADVIAIMQHPAQVFGSDGLHLRGRTHPRLYGCFARVLSRYVRETGALSLPEAVRKMTCAPAQRLGLRDRGRIAAGMAADMVLFDPATVRDRATYEEPLRLAEGIDSVWVNGVAVKRGGLPTMALPGKVLQRG